jgi:hypothetical protein
MAWPWVFPWGKKEVKPEVKIGQVWMMNNDDPWNDMRVEVMDMKDGWVRYRYLPYESRFSKSISEFLQVYKLYKEV